MRCGSQVTWTIGLVVGLLTLAPLARAQEAQADAPLKVAVVVAGDPDAHLVEAASRVTAALSGTEGLLLPSDEALRAALAGAPQPADDDGLGEARAARRRLALGDAAAQAALAQLGRMAGAVALVVVRRTPDPTAEVYDVDRGAYFEGRIDAATADPQAIARFVLRRARAARAHVGEPVEAVAPPPAAAAEAVMPPTAADAASVAEPAAAAGDEREAPRHPWIRRNWPYFVAGALLAGAVTYIVVSRHGDQAEPVVRIRPGGS
jgi:hypothetical protein